MTDVVELNFKDINDMKEVADQLIENGANDEAIVVALLQSRFTLQQTIMFIESGWNRPVKPVMTLGQLKMLYSLSKKFISVFATDATLVKYNEMIVQYSELVEIEIDHYNDLS